MPRRSTRRTDNVPRHASRSANTKVSTATTTAITPTTAAASPVNASNPTARAAHANGPDGVEPGGCSGVSGDAGTDATSDISATPTTEPATAIDREVRASSGRIVAEPS